jgi:hypothetical protein
MDTLELIGGRERVQADFGTLVNIADNEANASDDLRFSVAFRILDVEGNQRDDEHTLNTDVVYKNGTRFVNKPTKLITIVEPTLRNSIIDDISIADGRDNVTFTVTVTHTDESSRAPAYQSLTHVHVIPECILHPETINISLGSLSESLPVLEVINSSYFTVFFERMNPGDQTLVFSYETTVVDSVRPKQTLTQTVETEWTSVGSNYTALTGLVGRFHNGTDILRSTAKSSHSMAIHVPGISLELFNTSIAETTGAFVNIHEAVVYRATLFLPEGHQNPSVSVTLPTGLSFITASVVAIGDSISNANLTSGDTLSTSTNEVVFNFGELQNIPDNVNNTDDQIIVEVVAQVSSISGNKDGISRETITAVQTTAPTTLASDSHTVTIVEPRLLTQSIGRTPATAVDAGDNITYSVTIRHASASSSAAFDVKLVAEVDASLHILEADVGELSLSPQREIASDIVNLSTCTLQPVPSS